ncbi:putative transcriptional regulatory protein C1F7.11c [Psilocybe cubensis]|uniref:Transcriptional regulatory protein C1F7.11c n=1 Tax=Psilocybe cubensis TaxID=181762 RepID=A0ACB8GVL1_PSICU|nr:putative transcriptional regulatory protein C1F7.11c [Psilocybe cubensis]KAH9479634.1 putative transcriptional regulatory protein C1F7.11c [Psilocybe cubensis]
MPSSASPPYPSREDSAQSGSSLVARHPKRRGVALSCAECRRLKLKCSRAFPCSNCVKKGCAAICPEGSLTTGKGNRFVLANTEALHEKITVLANRVRQLEDGLAQSHAATSHTPHPLLSEELLQIKRPLERERLDVPQVEEKPETEDNIDSLGSLSISNDGKSTFFGRTASSWNEEGSEDEEELPAGVDDIAGPSDPAWLSYSFPFSPPIGKMKDALRQSLISKLPRMPLAKIQCDNYFRHAAWMYTPITEVDFNESVWRPMYELEGSYDTVSAHHLAILFMVLAIGTLLDLDREAHSPEAMQLYHYGRAALSIDCVLEEQTIAGIQAMFLMCHFMFLAEIYNPRWTIMGMIVKVAQSVNRDSGKWNLDPEQTRKRRELFYELLTYDSWQSFTFGRPPSLSSAHIDNQMPHETTKNSAGEIEMSFAAWKHRFVSQCLSIVHDEGFGTRTPSYKVVQDLDRKVRNWYFPPSLQVPGFGAAAKLVSTEVEQPTVQLTMQRYTAFAIKEMCKHVSFLGHSATAGLIRRTIKKTILLLIALFYMHRGFFAQALEDNPNDPMGSKYSPSVLAAYTSATSFVGLIESLYNQHPQLTERMWFLFTHVFSCAIVLGSIAAKSQMGLARSALSHLDSAYNLFTRVTDKARAGKIIPILAKLRERAQMANSNLPLQPENATRLSFYGPKIKSEVDELSTLGGMTRLVSRKSSGSPSVSAPSPPSHHSSPSNLAESQIYLANPPEQSNANAWQNYTHIQNFNVNINMGDYYPNGATADPQGDMSLLYQIPNHSLQQQPQSMSLDMNHGHHHQSYYSNSYGGYGNGNQFMMSHMTASPELTTPTHDMQESWQNLMAQYR